MTWDTITFDCYGTLVDWDTGISRTLVEAAAEHGMQLATGDVLAAYHAVEPSVQSEQYRPYRDVLRETALRVAERLDWQLGEEHAGFLTETLPDWPVFEDTRPALERLKSRFNLAILSNIDNDLLGATMKRIGVEFDWVVTAEQVRSYKPAPGHFHEALRQLEDRERWIHAAQSYFHDIRPAREFGVSAVWVNRKRESQPPGPTPLRVFSDLTELADWLDV